MAEKPDALAEIEEALGLARVNARRTYPPSVPEHEHAAWTCYKIRRALSLLPRLRAVVEAAVKYLEPFETDVEPLRAALARLGESPEREGE